MPQKKITEWETNRATVLGYAVELNKLLSNENYPIMMNYIKRMINNEEPFELGKGKQSEMLKNAIQKRAPPFYFIEDEDAISPHEATIRDDLCNQLHTVLGSLTPREESVLRMRFGIGTQRDLTLEEVGKNFSVTRERIRQIEAKAIKKLKHPNRKKHLESFVKE